MEKNFTLSETYMQRCFELANRGGEMAAPNPMVGAVLVYQDRIIGEGFHHFSGGNHAEVECIQSVKPADKHLISQSTLYVNLEPCNHYGKTPPCTNMIIDHKIKKVVIANVDPFEKVKGSGIKRLLDAGIHAEVGVLQNEGSFLNRRFFTFHRLNRPYIILKWAQTADCFIGKEGALPLKITDRTVDTLTHKWRAEESAIMIGSRTAIVDNPHLTVRNWRSKHPLRVVLDRGNVIPENHHLLTDEFPTLIFNNSIHKENGIKEFISLDNSKPVLDQVMASLTKKNILSVYVEGGALLHKEFFKAGLWDELRVITNTEFLLEQGVQALIPSIPRSHQERINTYHIDYYYRNK